MQTIITAILKSKVIYTMLKLLLSFRTAFLLFPLQNGFRKKTSMKTWRDIRKNKDFGIKQTRVWITASPQRGREKPSQRMAQGFHQYHFSRFHVCAFNIQYLFFSSWWTYLQGTNRDAGIENGPREERGGVNWEALTLSLHVWHGPAGTPAAARANGLSSGGSDDLEGMRWDKGSGRRDMCVLCVPSLYSRN